METKHRKQMQTHREFTQLINMLRAALAATATPQRRGVNKRKLFITVLEAEVRESGASSWLLLGPLLSVQPVSSPCPHTAAPLSLWLFS